MFWKQIPFPKGCAFLYLEFRTWDKVQKPSNSEYLVTYDVITHVEILSRNTGM
jgi:hypothetical protein